MITVIDVEGDGLEPTKLHVLSYTVLEDFSDVTSSPVSVTNYDDMKKILEDSEYVIGHNFMLWDRGHLERLLGIDIQAKIIDTLFLSWYCFPSRGRHGLDNWGQDLGIKKPEIEDWSHGGIEEYRHRCEEDVRITHRLWVKLFGYLRSLYGSEDDVYKILDYLRFKGYCAYLAQKSRWKLDPDRTRENLSSLVRIRDEKYSELSSAMPKVPVYTTMVRPKKTHTLKKDLTKRGQLWYNECRRLRKNPLKTSEIQILKGYKEPNPNSHVQLKSWLFSLGWEPCTFKQNDKKKDVPQILDLDDKEELTPSVERLLEKEPSIESLKGYFLLNHRISLLEGFLENQKDGYVTAEIGGLTNTLRFKHSVLVNLPGVHRPYGKEIRECLIAPEGYELCGSDQAGLEDRTKQHYIYPHDPEYVKEMLSEDWDPHLDIGLTSGMLTKEQVQDYKSGDPEKIKEIKPIRHKAKTTNYSCTYGAFPPKIAKSAGIPIEEAKDLFEAYWKRNWAIKKIASLCRTKTLEGQTWLWNPVSGLWYSLRFEKDRFSTLNQGTGSFCFDVWLGFILKKRPEITAQFHDEGVFCIKKGYRKEMGELLNEAIEEANEALGLNRRLDITVEFGDSYAEIH